MFRPITKKVMTKFQLQPSNSGALVVENEVYTLATEIRDEMKQEAVTDKGM